MNAYNKEVLNSYAAQQFENETVRDTEARILISCANQMKEACKAGTEFDVYLAALKRNQKLWTFFQAALVDKENDLSRELKTLLLNLSVFVDKTTFEAIIEFKPELLATLIDINLYLADGLRQKTEKPSTTSVSQSLTPPPEFVAGSVMTSA